MHFIKSFYCLNNGRFYPRTFDIEFMLLVIEFCDIFIFTINSFTLHKWISAFACLHVSNPFILIEKLIDCS